ncbi:MAG: alpha/beta fold hydrolase [Candidatus Kapaibacterium sp.]
MAYFNYGGKKVYYGEKGEGSPLLMVHGNTASARMLDSEIDYYSQYFHVIYFDFPGHGRSERLDQFCADFWRCNAEAAVILLGQLGIESLQAIGTSGGAMTVMNIATQKTKLFTKFIADSFFGNELTKEEVERMKRSREKSKKETLPVAWWKKMHGDDWESIIDKEMEMLERMADDPSQMIIGDVTKIESETLFTCSPEDKLIPNIEARMRRLCEQMQHCRIEVFDGGAHPLMVTEKEKFRALALDFLDK